MVKNKIGIKTLVVILLVSLAFLPAANAQEESSNEIHTSNVVSVDKAEKVASYSIKEISGSISDLSEWKDATVKLSTVYYDLDGNKSAYSFNVIKNKQQVGYVFISATKEITIQFWSFQAARYLMKYQNLQPAQNHLYKNVLKR